ncbi:TVP38/TMEM64 family protein [Thermosulfurimonas dismutans]|uniref:TVP38/TMEM64 family protein n=1 Tax=Thermosulfurimonas dismutans TaxID=999894 RepID=UPI001379D11D|nr:TVP38/TMEM64 family protein [Thermosulfurimonas dismutans]
MSQRLFRSRYAELASQEALSGFQGVEVLVQLWENREALRTLVESKGPLGPVIFVLIQAGQVVLAPLPGEATGLAAGFIFGAWEGFVLAMMGLALGSSAAFGLARLFRDLVHRHLARKVFYQKVLLFNRKHGPTAAFLLFLFPGFPKDYLCYALGLLPLPFRVFFPIMLLGRAPATLALTLEGEALYREDWRMVIWVAVVAVVVLGLFRVFKKRFYQEISV